MSFSHWSIYFSRLLYFLPISSSFWVLKTNIQLFAVIFLKLLFIGSKFFCGCLCDTNIFYIVNVSSLLRLPLSRSSASWRSVNYKIFLCSNSHFYSILFFPLINWFCSFEIIQYKKYNTFIQHAGTESTTRYNTTQSSYNTIIRHADTTYKF